MLKLLFATVLLLYGTIGFAGPQFPLQQGIERKSGEAKILTPQAELIFENDALLLDGKSELQLTLPEWKGESGTIIYDFMPVNWNGKKSQGNVVFVQSLDGSDGNFTLYKYLPSNGIWLLTQAILSPGKFKNQFPVMDRKALVNCQAGKWEQLAMVWKRREFVKVYLNGNLVGAASGSAFWPAEFTKIAIGRKVAGKDNDKTKIKNLTFERRPLSDSEIKLHYQGDSKAAGTSAETVIPLAAMRPPVLDGNISGNEYPTRLSGLLDSSKNFELMTDQTFSVWGMDSDFIYLGARISLPANYTLHSAATDRDDPRLISKGDLFVMFMVPDSAANQKKLSGIYFTLNPMNKTYDATESIDWGRSSCNRDVSVNLGIRSASKEADGHWTIELAIPRKAVGSNNLRIAAGFQINGIRYTLMPQPIWFDYYQGLVRLTASDIGVKTTHECNSDGVREYVELSSPDNNTGTADFEIGSADLQRSSEGMVLDQFVNEKVEIVSGKSFKRQSSKFSTAQGKPDKLEFAAAINKPDIYMSSTRLKDTKGVFFQRQYLFRLFNDININLAPVPSLNKLTVNLTFFGKARKYLKDGRVKLVLKHNDGKISLEKEFPAHSASQTALPLDKLDNGNYKLTVTMLDKSGNPVCSNSANWNRPAPEAWRQNRSAIDALSPDWCPEPWQPITTDHDVFSVWGRNYDWNGNSLLRQITSQHEKLFSAPAAMKALTATGETTVVWSPVKVISKTAGRVELERTGRLPGMQLKAQYILEFDGLVQVRIQAKPDSAMSLKKLFIDFSFSNTSQMAVQSRTWWQVGNIRREQWKSFPSIWLGNDRIGCNITAESCRGWWIDSTEPRVEILPDNKGATVRLLIVNKPGKLKHELDFSFLVQAGPVKPNFNGWQDFRLVGGTRPAAGGNAFYVDPRFWSSSYSRPLPLNYERFNDMIKSCHATGHKTYCYLTPFAISTYDIIPRNSPVTKWAEPLDKFVKWKKKDSQPVKEYFYNAADWNLQPAQLTGDGVAGRETTEMAYLAPDGSWADFFAASIEEMLKKSDVDGFYFDLPLPQKNFDDSKQLSYTTRDGSKEGTVQLLAARNLYKRLYWLFAKYRAGRHPWLIGHHIRELYPINAFCDLELHGEGLKPKKAFDYTRIWHQPLVKGTPIAQPKTYSSEIAAPGFNTAHAGTHSIPSIVLPQYGYSVELGRDPRLARELLGWTLSKGALLWPVYIHSSTVTGFWQQLEQRWGGFKDTKFSDALQAGIKISPSSLYGGFYSKTSGEEGLLIIFNSQDKSAEATIITPEAYRNVSDFETGKMLTDGNTIKIKIPPYDFKVLKLKR